MVFQFFPSFFDRPPKIFFAEQEEDEDVEIFLRQHFITNVPWILTAIFLFVLPPILIQLDSRFSFNLLNSIPQDLRFGVIILWYLLVLAYVIEHFLFWYFNVYIVTNVHIIDVDFFSLLQRDIVAIHLKDIESVSSNIKGIFASLFNYGDVQIETAAKAQEIIFEAIPKPDIVADRIQDLREQFSGGQTE